MKPFIYILLSLLLTSCFTHKMMKKPHFKNDIDSTIVVKDSIKSDSLVNVDLDGVPDFKDSVITITVGSSNGDNPYNNNINYNTSSYHQTSAEVVIVDNTDKLKISEGIIAYSVPTEMKVANRYIIKVRITKDNSENGKTVLVIGDRHIPINDETVDSKVTIENIRVDKVMTSEILYDSLSFYVKPLNTKVQDVDSIDYTEWSWEVMPLKSGKGYLKLIVKVKSTDKDIVVFDRAIQVKSNIGYSINTFIGNYWQWIMTTIIIPLIVFFYKRRKKKKKK